MTHPASVVGISMALLLLASVPSPLTAQAQTNTAQPQPDTDRNNKYVSDQLEITLRSGPGTSFAIRRMIKSGTSLDVVEENGEGYTKAQLADGTTGWVLSRFLTDEPVAREKLAEIELRMEDVRQKGAQVEEKLLGLNELKADLERVKTENLELQAKLEQLDAVALDSEKATEENRVLKQTLESSRVEQQTLIEENERLTDTSTQNWFLIGAGVTIMGILIGLAIPNIRWKKKQASMGNIKIKI